MEVSRLEEEESQCPGCGTTWIGHSGFGPTSGEFPSKNAVSCPVHRSTAKLLAALEAVQRDFGRRELTAETVTQVHDAIEEVNK